MKPLEKAVKNPKNQVCAKKYQKDSFAICDQIFPRVLPFYVAAADLAVPNYIYVVPCMFFLRPLAIQVLSSNGRVKLVLWTDWAMYHSPCVVARGFVGMLGILADTGCNLLVAGLTCVGRQINCCKPEPATTTKLAGDGTKSWFSLLRVG